MTNINSSLSCLIAFLGHTKGKRARPSTNDSGVDFFSPLPGTSVENSIQFVGHGEVLSEFPMKISMISIKKERETTQEGVVKFDRLRVLDLKPVGTRQDGRSLDPTAWWSIPMFEFPTREERDQAIAKLIEENPAIQQDIFTFDALKEACEAAVKSNDVRIKESALGTLKLLANMAEAREGEGRGLPHQIANKPKKFNLENSCILFYASCAPGETDGYYTNAGRRPRQGNARSMDRNSGPAIAEEFGS